MSTVDKILQKSFNKITTNEPLFTILLTNYDIIKQIAANAANAYDFDLRNFRQSDSSETHELILRRLEQNSENLLAEILEFIKKDPIYSFDTVQMFLRCLHIADQHMQYDEDDRFTSEPGEKYKSIFSTMSNTDIWRKWSRAYLRLVDVAEFTSDHCYCVKSKIRRSVGSHVFKTYREIIKKNEKGAQLSDQQAADELWSLYDSQVKNELYEYMPLQQVFIEFVLVTLASIKLTSVVIYHFKRFVDSIKCENNSSSNSPQTH